jgi:hypothetical protein
MEPHFKPSQFPRLRPTSSSPSQIRYSPPLQVGRSPVNSPLNMSFSPSPLRWCWQCMTSCSCCIWVMTQLACLGLRCCSTPRELSRPRYCPPAPGTTSSMRLGTMPSSSFGCLCLPRPRRTLSCSTAARWVRDRHPQERRCHLWNVPPTTCQGRSPGCFILVNEDGGEIDLNVYLTTLHTALPPHTALLPFSGHSNPCLMA